MKRNAGKTKVNRDNYYLRRYDDDGDQDRKSKQKKSGQWTVAMCQNKSDYYTWKATDYWLMFTHIFVVCIYVYEGLPTHKNKNQKWSS